MKKYLLFSISFIISFVIFQILYGYFLTFSYAPDIDAAWNHAGSLSSVNVMKGSSTFFSLLIAFLAATIAYVTSEKLIKITNQLHN